MTVGEAGKTSGELVTVTRELEEAGEGDTLVGETRSVTGVIYPNLQVGVNLTNAQPLKANGRLCAVGMKTIGAGFLITEEQAEAFGAKTNLEVTRHVRPYLNGRDLMSRTRGKHVIDFYGLSEEQVRTGFPELYQYLRNHVYDLRQQNNNSLFREFWWVLGHSRPVFRAFTAGLSRYVVTLETAKHQVFQFIDASVIPDSTLVTFGFDDAYMLGVLSSRSHVLWSLAQGGTLEDRPRYNKTTCFETFPFPDASEVQKARIRELAQNMDDHRKARQVLYPALTITGLYNVLAKLRSGEPLDAGEQRTHDQGLVTVLKELHDELDTAVAAAYGWPADLGQQNILANLAALNAARTLEERAGTVRYLRPDYQDPKRSAQGGLGITVAATAAKAAPQIRFPASLPAQVQAVRQHLQQAGQPLTAGEVIGAFSGAKANQVEEIIATLVMLGQVRLTAADGTGVRYAA
ncbi:type IIL restriction-modification enzyme MmeI [Deinococcus sp. YIM 134068]|uniref:type IIL restriction-modification enzyme MmeI n=1 Tax=Deinococcus lichenicola TaxID=3118910 RepID=UPI002F93D9A3